MIDLMFLKKFLLEGKSFDPLTPFGLMEKDFSPEGLKALDCIKRYVYQHSMLPSIPEVEAELGYQLPDSSTIPCRILAEKMTWKDAVRDLRKLSALASKAIITGSLEEIYQAFAAVQQTLEKRMSFSPVSTHGELVGKYLEELTDVQEGKPIPLHPFGIAPIDDTLLGYSDSDMVVIAGDFSVGKSYVLLHLLYTAQQHFMELRPDSHLLLVTTEMSPIEMSKRLLSIQRSVNIDSIRNYTLSSHMGMEAAQRELNNSYVKMYRIDPSKTVESLFLYIRETKPAAVFIDGTYFLQSSAKSTKIYENQAIVASSLKMFSSCYDIPMIVVYQMAPDSGGIVFGARAVNQAADIILEVSRDYNSTTDSINGGSLYPYQFINSIRVSKGRNSARGTKVSVMVDPKFGTMRVQNA